MEVEIQVKRFDQLKKYPEISRQEFSDSMFVGVEKVLSEAQILSPVDRGLFRSSLATDVVEPSPMNIVGKVFASAPHSAVIEGVDEDGNPTEFGRRPGAAFPNIGELRGWVERVIIGKQLAGDFIGPVRSNLSIQERVDEATLWIGRAIVRRGIKAKRPIGRAMERNREFLQRLFEDATTRIARQIEGRKS
jgi:hypothetical protein